MIDTILTLTALLNVVPVLYAVALFLYGLAFARDEGWPARLARPALILAILVHLGYLVGFTAFFEYLPVVSTFQAAGLVGFAMAVLYLLVETRTGTRSTGPFALALVTLFQVLSALYPKLNRDMPEVLESTWFSLHVTAAVIGYAGFALAAVFGLLYLLQYRQIRSKQFGLLFHRLPALEVLDRMNLRAAVLGWGFLTLAIAAGTIWGLSAFPQDLADAKLWVAALTWAVYGAAVIGHRFAAWRGTPMAYASLVGFLVVLFSFFAVNFFLTGYHEFTS